MVPSLHGIGNIVALPIIYSEADRIIWNPLFLPNSGIYQEIQTFPLFKTAS